MSKVLGNDFFADSIRKGVVCFLIFLFLFFFTINSLNAETGQAKESVLQKETEAVNQSRRWNGDSIRRSIVLFQESAIEWEKLGEARKASNCLRESALLLMILSDYDKARNDLEKALRMDNKDNFLEGKIISLSILSRVYGQAGNTRDSEKYYKQALSFSRSSVSALAQANALFSAAEYNLFFGNIKDTIGFYEKALLQAEKAGDKKLSAQILNNLGYSYLREGNLVAGLQKEKESLARAEEAEDLRGQAIAYNGIGSLYVFMDEKRTALELFKKAEAMYPDDFDWLEKGKLLNGIATIYEDFGEFGLAEKYRRNAFDLFGKAKYPYGQLATLPSLAKLSFVKGEKKAEQKFYDEALILARQLKSSFHLAIIKEDLGRSYFAGGFYDKAIENYLEALQVYESLRIKLPRIQNALGEAFAAKGESDTARNYFNAALNMNRQTKDMLPAAENLYHLAKLDRAEGHLQKSLEKISESLAITESVYRQAGNNKLGTSYISNIFHRYELYISLLMKFRRQSPGENYGLQALQASEKARARVLLETLALSEVNFTKDANPEIVRREKEIRVLLNAKADKLTDLLSQNAESRETEIISHEISELENELEEIKAKLKEQSPVYSAIKNPVPFDVGEFQKNVLDDDSLLLEFSFGKEESYLWLIGKTEFGSYVLPPREQIESKIQTLRELLAARERLKDKSIEDYQTGVKNAEEEYSKIAKQLSSELFGQVAGKFGGKRLIIVPDGKLGYFPVSALPLPDSEKNEPILLTNEVVYEPSASTLSILAKNNKQTNRAAKSLLIFSDPVFSADDSRLSPENQNDLSASNETGEKFRFVESLNSLVRLNGSKTEADSIIEILGASNADNFTGFSANRERLLDTNAADYKILHFATHGLIDESRPELSGIVLSRFDESGKKQDEFFRLHDIYGMNLHADLIVLSACNTGIGKEVRGEGLTSLNNAFLSVGAKSVMSSLWKVEDGATLELMKNFYDAMANENLPPSKALQKAQIKMQKSGRYQSPFYWAAFTVQGDYKNVPEISAGFGNWVYLLPVAVVLFLGAFSGFRFIRRRNRK